MASSICSDDALIPLPTDPSSILVGLYLSSVMLRRTTCYLTMTLFGNQLSNPFPIIEKHSPSLRQCTCSCQPARTSIGSSGTLLISGSMLLLTCSLSTVCGTWLTLDENTEMCIAPSPLRGALCQINFIPCVPLSTGLQGTHDQLLAYVFQP
jgi:hypothetical protein